MQTQAKKQHNPRTKKQYVLELRMTPKEREIVATMTELGIDRDEIARQMLNARLKSG